jgi:heptosyltransferase-2
MKNILVVNVNWLGDVIFSSPIFRALKKQYPDARISCLVPPRVQDVLACIPEIDETIVYDEKGAHRFPWSKLRLVLQLRAKRFDAAFLLHRSLTKAMLVFLAGIPIRVGYDTKKRKAFLTHPVKEETKMHRSDYYLNVIESYGIPVLNRTCYLSLPAEATAKAEELLKKAGINHEPFIIVNPGGNWNMKRWPKENYRKLIKQLALKNKIVITGSQKDISLAKEISQDVLPRPAILAGQTGLKELMGIMQKASLIISADSGPLHVANALGVKTIGIFGPTRREITGPKGSGPAIILQKEVGCNVDACYHLTCPDNICMQAVTVEDVLDAIKKTDS